MIAEQHHRAAMTKLASLGLIAFLPTVIASHAWAQEANPEPAYCAQYYPNADCNSITELMLSSVSAVSAMPAHWR